MENNKLNLRIDSLKEQDKTATSLEDIYGYYVLSDEFQNQIEEYNRIEKENREKSVELVFNNYRTDDFNIVFDMVMEANTNIVIDETQSNTGKQESIVTVLLFFSLGAFVTFFVLILIERKRNHK